MSLFAINIKICPRLISLYGGRLHLYLRCLRSTADCCSVIFICSFWISTPSIALSTDRVAKDKTFLRTTHAELSVEAAEIKRINKPFAVPSANITNRLCAKHFVYLGCVAGYEPIVDYRLEQNSRACLITLYCFVLSWARRIAPGANPIIHSTTKPLSRLRLSEYYRVIFGQEQIESRQRSLRRGQNQQIWTARCVGVMQHWSHYRSYV